MNELIRKEIARHDGSGENSSITLLADTKTGECEIVVRKEYVKRFSLTEYEKAKELFDGINGSGMVVDLDVILKFINHEIE